MPSAPSSYSSAIYEIYEPQIIVRVGERSEMLDKLLEQHGDEEWAFITPFNPYPDTLSDIENRRRLDEMKRMLASYVTYLGEGRGDEEHPCAPEVGEWILGITREEAREIGNHFGQKAILAGSKGKPVDLVVLR